MVDDARKAYRVFYETPLGKLFLEFERCHGKAWQANAASGYVDSMLADINAAAAWEKQRAARSVFVAELMKISADDPNKEDRTDG